LLIGDPGPAVVAGGDVHLVLLSHCCRSSHTLVASVKTFPNHGSRCVD
jgi:hypothetical protein